MLPAGKSLRTLREKLGLTMRDIEMSSARMAEKYRNEEYSIPPSRLSDIETKGVLPSIFRLYALAVIYRRDLRELMAWYGVNFVLGKGLHSYGFGLGGETYVASFVIADLLFVAFAIWRYRKSRRVSDQSRQVEAERITV